MHPMHPRARMMRLLALACALAMASGAAEPVREARVAAAGAAANRKVLVGSRVLPTATDGNSTSMTTGLPDDFVQVRETVRLNQLTHGARRTGFLWEEGFCEYRAHLPE